MSLARLVVIEGPDAGREFELPLRGGRVGRGDGSLVQLTDPTVSRQHGLIELRDGALCWVDDSGKPRTLINGAPATLRVLQAGDEIVLGATKLVYRPVERTATMRVTNQATMEVGSRQRLARTSSDSGPRARGHLAALAELGERLLIETTTGRDAIARTACHAALTALAAHRAFLFAISHVARSRVSPLAAAVTA